MSRTTRKRKVSFEEYYRYYFSWFIIDEDERIRRRVEYYTSSNKWFSHSLPKEFRNSVNRTRRRKDKREIWKAVNINDYEEQCSRWNCKDNNAWGYW